MELVLQEPEFRQKRSRLPQELVLQECCRRMKILLL
jgi:hypothetical protein